MIVIGSKLTTPIEGIESFLLHLEFLKRFLVELSHQKDFIGLKRKKMLFQSKIFLSQTLTSSFEVARLISDDSYGLVFGFNTFVALLFQSILTLVVADDAGLALPPRTQAS